MSPDRAGRSAGFPGNLQPSTGNIELRAMSCGTNILTLSQGSSAGKFLVCRKNTSALSTVGTSDLFAISSVGSLVGGLPANNVTGSAVTGWSATAVDLGSTGQGQMYFVTALASGLTLTLPTTSAGERVFIAEGNNAAVIMAGASTGTLVTAGSKSGDSVTVGATGASIGYGYEWFTNGSYWYCFPFPPSAASTLAASTLANLVASS